MLPIDFEWRRYIDAPTAYLGGEQVAILAKVHHGWRLELVPNTVRRHYLFLRTEEGAKRYVEAWVRRWEQEIRQCSEGFSRPALATTESERRIVPPPTTTHPRHRKARRTWGCKY